MTVSPDTIAVALGRTAPVADSPEEGQWIMWIDDARMLISARLGDLELLDQDKLNYVVREAVVAQVRRPDDATTVAVSVDDGSVSKAYRTSSGRVTIRDEWWDLLSPTDSRAGAFSIFPGASGGLTGHAPWCSLMFLGTTCSCGYALSAGQSWFMESELDE
jgi:hypothetical protein